MKGEIGKIPSMLGGGEGRGRGREEGKDWREREKKRGKVVQKRGKSKCIE